MEGRAINAAASLAGRSFEDFPAATRALLETLESQLPGSVVFVGHLDDAQHTFRIVDARGNRAFGIEPGVTVDLDASFCLYMAGGHAPQLCNRAAADPVYGSLAAQQERGIESYLGVPLQLSDGTTVGSLCALSDEIDRFTESDLQLVGVMARMLAYELERRRRDRQVEQLMEQLRAQARTDALTGLLNKATFMDELEREWKLTQRDGIASHVAVLDLDGFKAVNDEHGHTHGDRMLRRFAAALRAVTRRTDVVGRLGGDEFGVVLVRSSPGDDAPQRLAGRLQAALIGEDIVGFSVGVTTLAGTASPDEALDAADRAMYRVKRGRAVAR